MEKRGFLDLYSDVNVTFYVFMCIHLVSIFRTEKGVTYYLIKWRDSNYDMATWEPEDSPIPDFKKSIENYENLRLVSFIYQLPLI